jgi:hypothetical protein
MRDISERLRDSVQHDLPVLKSSVDAFLTGQEGTSNT